MAYNPLIIGQQPMSSSQGVVIASDQTPVSVSGTVGASVIGTVPVVQSGTVITSLVSTIPSSVQVGASIMGHAPVFIVGGSVATSTTNSSVMLLNGANVIGSVTALQGTNPWIVVSSLAGGLFPISGSVAAIITNTNINVGGSVVGFQGGTTISSLVSTIPSSVIVGASIFGQLPAGTAPLGSVATLQGTNPWLVSFGNSSILAGQTGTRISSLVSTVPSSVIVGTSIFGQLPAGTAPLGSVATLQGTNPWVVTNAGSIISINTGSIITTQIGSVITVFQAPSIVGTYAEDIAHATSDKGVFVLGVRNDAVSSITSAERDYSPIAVDSAGRNIFIPFAGQQACIISYTGSIVSTSVQLIAASIAGSRSYITDFWLSNTGASGTLVYFKDGSTSIIGHGIAPTLGGESSPGIAIPLRTAPSQDLVFTPLTATSVLYLTVKGYQAP